MILTQSGNKPPSQTNCAVTNVAWIATTDQIRETRCGYSGLMNSSHLGMLCFHTCDIHAVPCRGPGINRGERIAADEDGIVNNQDLPQIVYNHPALARHKQFENGPAFDPTFWQTRLSDRYFHTRRFSTCSDNTILILFAGGTKGIGKSIVEGFLAEGANVSYCSRSARGDEFVKFQHIADGARAVGTSVDIGDKMAVENWAKTAAKEFGRIDVVVANGTLLGI